MNVLCPNIFAMDSKETLFAIARDANVCLPQWWKDSFKYHIHQLFLSNNCSFVGYWEQEVIILFHCRLDLTDISLK